MHVNVLFHTDDRLLLHPAVVAHGRTVHTRSLPHHLILDQGHALTGVVQVIQEVGRSHGVH